MLQNNFPRFCSDLFVLSQLYTHLSGMMEESIRQNATVALDQAEYQKRFDDLSQRFDTAKQQHSEVSDRISDLKSRKGEMMDFLKLLKKQEDEVTCVQRRPLDWPAGLCHRLRRWPHDLHFQERPDHRRLILSRKRAPDQQFYTGDRELFHFRDSRIVSASPSMQMD